MAQDFTRTENEDQWLRLATMVETAASARRCFPQKRFEGIDSTSMQVLAAVVVWPGSSVGDLAQALAFEKSSVSKPIAELEAQGLVLSRRDATDGRRRFLEATERGKQFAAEYLDSLDSIER